MVPLLAAEISTLLRVPLLSVSRLWASFLYQFKSRMLVPTKATISSMLRSIAVCALAQNPTLGVFFFNVTACARFA